MWWQKPLTDLKGIGKVRAGAFANLNLITCGDLLTYYPRKGHYIDHTKLQSIRELIPDRSEQICAAQVVQVTGSYSRRGIPYAVVTVKDATGFAEVVLYAAQRFQTRKLRSGMEVLITGKVEMGGRLKSITGAVIQPYQREEMAQRLGVVPTYHLSGSLTNSQIIAAVRQVLKLAAEEGVPESLPAHLIERKKLLMRRAAIENMHFPTSFALLEKARERLAFEELFLIQYGLLRYRMKLSAKSQAAKLAPDGPLIRAVQEALPFHLTKAQQKAWGEISASMQDKRPMRRLLEGDVGSGKTVVAALALAKAVENGYQGAIMVPTEILAQQHYETFMELLSPHNITVALLTGSAKVAQKRAILAGLSDGSISVVVGTHALIQEAVVFRNLELVITDEQHRFGVEQRAKLSSKANLCPDVLIMTATPIPRTLALTYYGDLDVSSMRGMPPGRKRVETLSYDHSSREKIYAGVVRQVKAGHQAYVVCPFIEESEVMEGKAVIELYAELTQGYLRGIKCGLLHGRLSTEEKERVMADFAANRIQVLLTTTVIEVGVNVPNATLMIIEGAERFGLSQLHQLRGRVGRGSAQSYCVLITNKKSAEIEQRLKIMCDNNDGFALAEEDLKLRGAGQLFGYKQHGLPDLKVADFNNRELLEEVRRDAQEVFADPKSYQEMEELLTEQIEGRFAQIFNT